MCMCACSTGPGWTTHLASTSCSSNTVTMRTQGSSCVHVHDNPRGPRVCSHWHTGTAPEHVLNTQQQRQGQTLHMRCISHIKRISSCRYPRPNIEFLFGGGSCGKRGQAGWGGMHRITRHFQRVCTQHLGLGECCNEPVAGHAHLACRYSLLPSPVPSARISTRNNLRLRLHPPRKQLPHKRVCDVAAAAASRSLSRALLEFAHHVLRIHVSVSIGITIAVEALAFQSFTSSSPSPSPSPPRNPENTPLFTLAPSFSSAQPPPPPLHAT